MQKRLPTYNGLPGELLIKDVFLKMNCGELHRLKDETRHVELRRILKEAYKRKCETSPQANIPQAAQPPPAPRKVNVARRVAGGSKKKP